MSAIKVIAVRLPFDLQERLLAFPFMHAIKEKYKDAEIHFISPKKNIEILNLLPFSAYYHEIENNEISTIFDVHRFCANAKIFNVDLFISLTNSFVDASFGLFLRAKQRLGFADNWKSLLLNQNVKRPIGHHICEEFFELYRTHVKADVDLKLKVMSRTLSPVVPDWDSHPYIAINLSHLDQGIIDEEWVKLVQEFENQRIIFFCSEDPERIALLIQSFIAKLPKTNAYSFFMKKDWIELAKMLAYAKGVITYEGALASVAAYVGAKVIILYDRRDPQKEGPLYFLSDIVILSATDPTIGIRTPEALMKSKSLFNMQVVHEKAVQFFRLI